MSATKERSAIIVVGTATELVVTELVVVEGLGGNVRTGDSPVFV